MAHQVNVVFVDDITKEPASETVRFSIDGTAYEIDLTEENAKKFREAILQFVEHARPARRAKPRAVDSEAARVRSWARENGIHINERGRIPAAVLNAYNSASGIEVSV